jgi:hypothetical protein
MLHPFELILLPYIYVTLSGLYCLCNEMDLQKAETQKTLEVTYGLLSARPRLLLYSSPRRKKHCGVKFL